MPAYEVSRRLVKSPPELREELHGDRIPNAIAGATIRPTEDENAVVWEAEGIRGTARIEGSGWGTKVTLTAEVEERVADHGLWSRLRGDKPAEPPDTRIEQALEAVLDDLGSAHKKPFQGS
jgi:hypothetical protein